MVDAEVVFLWFEDFVEAIAQSDEFFVGEEALEETELCPLAEAAEGFVDFGAAFVVRDVVSDEVEGGHL